MSVNVIFNVLLVLSNIAIIPSIVKLIEIGDFIDGFLFSTLMIASMFYHGCEHMGACIIDVKILTFIDVVLASSLIVCLSLQYACLIHKLPHGSFTRQLKTILTLLLILINSVWFSINGQVSSCNQRVFTGCYCLFIVMYGLTKRYIKSDVNSSLIVGDHVNKSRLFVGLFISIIGFILFGVSQLEIFIGSIWVYSTTHTLWHLLSSVGVYLLLTATSVVDNKEQFYHHE